MESLLITNDMYQYGFTRGHLIISFLETPYITIISNDMIY